LASAVAAVEAAKAAVVVVKDADDDVTCDVVDDRDDVCSCNNGCLNICIYIICTVIYIIKHSNVYNMNYYRFIIITNEYYRFIPSLTW